VPRPINAAGRPYTLPIPRRASIVSVTAILDYPQVRHLPVGGGETRVVPPSGRPLTLLGRGSVVAFRQRQAIGLGSLRERTALSGERLVVAHDEAGHSWWISADAVWSDADSPGHPEHPRPIGLATAATWNAALVKGLSDRLGWEAVLEFERGGDLPVLAVSEQAVIANAIVLDGRLDHDVPTVIILAADTMRWGAGSTWDGAIRRALYGDDPLADADGELDELSKLLAADDLAVVAVDLGTPRLLAAGVARSAVQIVTGDASVRSWDAGRVN
jgi:hypothetical protein